MYFVLYDRNLKSIGETYLVEDWSRIQRAMDFSEARIIGEQISYFANPFFVVVNDEQGSMILSGLASTPKIDEKSRKTNILIKDYLTLTNSEVIVDWSKYSGSTVADYMAFVFSCWLDQVDVGFSGITYDVSRISDIFWDTDIKLGSDTENVVASTLIFDAMKYYGVFCESNLDLFTKTLTFVFKPCDTHRTSIQVSDLEIQLAEKSFGEYNRASVYSHDYTKVQEWSLTEDNQVVKLPSNLALVYPAKNRNFIAEASSSEVTPEQAQWNAVYEAVMELSNNRYQESIDINSIEYDQSIGSNIIDFSYKVDVYGEQGFYKTIPVGEIESDSKGNRIIRLGYRIQELTQEL